MSACTCANPPTVGRLLRQHNAATLKNLDMALEVDSSEVITSSIRCRACGTFYVISTVIATVPGVKLAEVNRGGPKGGEED